jgi:DNA-binding transcriptional LysR family regulator
MTQGRIDWERQIGHRFNLRHLHVFSTVVRSGSMGKAAGKLGVSQPAVSEVIAELEHAFGVRLLDRSPRGVEPTIYGDALLKRAAAVFDELKQGARDLQFLADPTVGELRIGYQESLSHALVAPAIGKFSREFPRVAVHADDLPSAAIQLSELRARRYDCTLQLLTRTLADEDDLNVEVLYNDRVGIAADMQGPWARRRKIDLAELAAEPWILTPPGTWAHARLADAFAAKGLSMPTVSVLTLAVPLREHLLTNSRCLTTLVPSRIWLEFVWRESPVR